VWDNNITVTLELSNPFINNFSAIVSKALKKIVAIKEFDDISSIASSPAYPTSELLTEAYNYHLSATSSSPALSLRTNGRTHACVSVPEECDFICILEGGEGPFFMRPLMTGSTKCLGIVIFMGLYMMRLKSLFSFGPSLTLE
jgi:hypothetical protein